MYNLKGKKKKKKRKKKFQSPYTVCHLPTILSLVCLFASSPSSLLKMRGSIVVALALLQLTAAAPAFINGGDRNLHEQVVPHKANAVRLVTESLQDGSHIPIPGDERQTTGGSPLFHSEMEARNFQSSDFIEPKIGVPVNTGDTDAFRFAQDKRTKIPFTLDKTYYGGLQDLKDRSSTLELSNSKLLPTVNKTPVWDFAGSPLAIQARSSEADGLDERSSTLELSNSKLLPIVNKTPVWDLTA